MADKYWVFKIAEDGEVGELVKDAVVIRRQDTLAPTTLATYAGLAMSAIEMLEVALTGLAFDSGAAVQIRQQIEHLHDSMEFFQAQADLSRREPRKLPD